MPKRRYPTRKRRFTRKGGYKRSKMRRVARVGTVRRMISRTEESKWRQGFTGPSTTTLFAFGTPFVVGLTNTVKGTSRDNRAGNQIRLSRLEVNLRYFLQAPVAGFVSSSICRVLIFYDKANNGVNLSTLTAANLIALLFADSATGNAYMSPLNPNFVPSRFKILMDRRFTMRVDGGATDAPDVRVLRKFMRLNSTVQFNDGNANDPTDIQKNAIYALFVTSSGASALGTQPVMEMEYLLKWKDA